MAKKLKTNLPGVKTVKANMPDIMIEANILTRLPVKTIIRFSLVCKSWYSLFFDTYFINMHKQIQKNKINNPLLLYYWSDNNPILITDSRLAKNLSFKYTTNFPHKKAKVVGYCDGIVCVFSESINKADFSIEIRISLWNPALRINKIIACGDLISHASRQKWSDMCVGFGYNNKTNDYNLITFFNNFFTLKHVNIYSLNSNSWRKIDQSGANHELLKRKNAGEQYGIYVSCRPAGAYCWLTLKQDREGYFREARIISFHMEDETFKEMMLPYNTTTDHGGENTLFIYKDSLAVLHTHDSDAFTPRSSKICTIWVMKEYGDPKSWTKLRKFDSQYPYVSFVGVIETDQIVLRCGESTLFIYKNSLAMLHTHNSDGNYRICYIWVMKEYDDPMSWTKLCKFDSERPYASFVGVIETDLILLLCGDLHDINKEVNVVDIVKSQKKLMSYTKDITKAWWASSFTESLALLKGVNSRSN